ncbi:hypothetical protein F5X99DRAFT_397462, partial [Biscogniauxia marginata]
MIPRPPRSHIIYPSIHLFVCQPVSISSASSAFIFRGQGGEESEIWDLGHQTFMAWAFFFLILFRKERNFVWIKREL